MEGIELPNQERIKTFGEKENYKYLEILETDTTKQIEMIHIYLYFRLIGLVSKVFAYGPGDLASIPGHVIPKTLKMVLDTSLLNI